MGRVGPTYLTGPPMNDMKLLFEPRVVEVYSNLENRSEVVKGPGGNCGIVISWRRRRELGMNRYDSTNKPISLRRRLRACPFGCSRSTQHVTVLGLLLHLLRCNGRHHPLLL